jgi:predicted protein tyrosine phosphatase
LKGNEFLSVKESVTQYKDKPFISMFFDFLDRHLAVCSAREIPSVAGRDPYFWHSISIMEPWRKLAPRQGLRDVLSLRFDDAENLETDETGITFPQKQHILDAMAFADERAGEPLLIQCWAGLSRSAAMALGLIARGLHKEGIEPFSEQAVQNLLLIRPQARPNVLVLRLVLETFLSAERAEAVTVEMVNHPTLLANRFHRC